MHLQNCKAFQGNFYFLHSFLKNLLRFLQRTDYQLSQVYAESVNMIRCYFYELLRRLCDKSDKILVQHFGVAVEILVLRCFTYIQVWYSSIYSFISNLQLSVLQLGNFFFLSCFFQEHLRFTKWEAFFKSSSPPPPTSQTLRHLDTQIWPGD